MSRLYTNFEAEKLPEHNTAIYFVVNSAGHCSSMDITEQTTLKERNMMSRQSTSGTATYLWAANSRVQWIE